MAVPELESLPGQQQVAFTLIQALDALRDGLRPFVVGVLREKEGPQWFVHPRVQRMVSSPPALEGEAPYGPEGPVLDLALLLKLIGADCYWYRTFRPRLPGISRWQIDSLRELRNRVAHNDGDDPLLTTASLGLPYFTTMEQLLHVIGSDQLTNIIQLRKRLQCSRRDQIKALILGKSPWSFSVWLAGFAVLGIGGWLLSYHYSPRLTRNTLVIGTPDKRLERYLPLERYLETRLRPANLMSAIRGDRIDVRVEVARSYPEAVANLRARRWDVLLGFSPVVSMEAVNVGYKPIGRMFPFDPVYHSILFSRKDSEVRGLRDISPRTRIALGDFFSATKYYIPMSLLQGLTAKIVVNLSTEEIISQVRNRKADIGSIAGNKYSFGQHNPNFQIVASSPALPPSVVALSPSLDDIDRIQLQLALSQAPTSIRSKQNANYTIGGEEPDYRYFERQVAEGKTYSACLSDELDRSSLNCKSHESIETINGWIEDAYPNGSMVRISLITADKRVLLLVTERALLDQSVVFKTLSELRGREISVISRRSAIRNKAIEVDTPHQLNISP